MTVPHLARHDDSEANASGRVDVSFIIAAYNVAPYIRQAIASALSQTGVSVEAIVADDASTDGTAEKTAAIAAANPRVRLIRLAENAGPSAARNAAMAAARGDWMAILDGDDLVTPARSRFLIDFATLTSADLVADNFERFYREGVATGQTMLPASAPYAFQVSPAAFMRANRAFSNDRLKLGAVKAMFRASFMRERGLRHIESLHFGEDYMLILDCLLAGARFAISSESHYKYRMRESSQSWRMQPGHIRQLLAAFDGAGIEARCAGSPEALEAAKAFKASFENAGQLTGLIDRAKQKQRMSALRGAAASPRLWPLIARFGAQAVTKRLRRKSPAPVS